MFICLSYINFCPFGTVLIYYFNGNLCTAHVIAASRKHRYDNSKPRDQAYILLLMVHQCHSFIWRKLWHNCVYYMIGKEISIHHIPYTFIRQIRCLYGLFVLFRLKYYDKQFYKLKMLHHKNLLHLEPLYQLTSYAIFSSVNDVSFCYFIIYTTVIGFCYKNFSWVKLVN